MIISAEENTDQARSGELSKQVKFIGFWKRGLISFIDLLIYSGYCLAFWFIGSRLFKFEINSDIETIYILIFFILIPIFFKFIMWKYTGASIGKLMFRVRIIDEETGYHPTDKQFLKRLLSFIFISNYSPFSDFHVAIDSRKQTWHDKISKMIVIKSSDVDQYKESNKSKSSARDKMAIKVEIVLFVIYLSCIIGANCYVYHDEKVLPGASQWIEESKFSDTDPKNNGFYYIIGFDCLEKGNQFESGYNWVKEENKKADIVNVVEFQSGAELPENEFDRVNFSKFNEIVLPAPLPLEYNYYTKNAEKIDSLMVSFSFLSKRYWKLNEYDYYEDNLISHFNIKVPVLIGIIKIKRLHLRWIAKEFLIGNSQNAISDLKKELIFSRQFLQNSTFLMGKLVGHVMIDADLELISFLLETNNFTLNGLPLNHITEEEKKWDDISRSIFMLHVTDFTKYFQPEFIESRRNGVFSKYLFKKNIQRNLKLNKAINRIYTDQNFSLTLSRLSANDFTAQRYNYEEFEPTKWDCLTDPTGSILAGIAVPIYHEYIMKFHEIDAQIDMIKLKSMLLSKKVKQNEVQAFLDAQSDSLYNIFSLAPYSWDNVKSSIYYEIDDDGVVKKDSVKVKLD